MKLFFEPAKRVSIDSTKAAMAHKRGNIAVKRILNSKSNEGYN
jgi:hypothetical protein